MAPAVTEALTGNSTQPAPAPPRAARSRVFEAITDPASARTRRTWAVTVPLAAPLPSQTLTRESRVPSTVNAWAAALFVDFTLNSAVSWRTCPSYGTAAAASGSAAGTPVSAKESRAGSRVLANAIRIQALP